jgi:hypothetical protein
MLIAQLFPTLAFPRWFPSRDQWILFLVAVNQGFLSLDTYLVHVLNGTILFREWIPIIFGLVSAVLLLVAGGIAQRNRSLASSLATVVLIASVVVGLLGAYFHLVRGMLPSAPVGQRFTLNLAMWAPPILAPLAFAGIAIMGMSAAWREDPSESGILHLPFGKRLHLPYSKTAAYLFLVSLGVLVALVSSVLDHARHPWTSVWLWLPVVAGVYGVVVSLGLGLLKKPHKGDVAAFVVGMVFLIVVGIVGAWLHIRADLGPRQVFVMERFLRGAPFLSPMLFANMGMVGLLVLLPAFSPNTNS